MWVVLGSIAAILVLGLLMLGIWRALPRTRRGYRLYGRKHLAQGVDELERKVIRPEAYEDKESVMIRKERSRAIADQIIEGKLKMPKKEFNSLFKSLFSELSRIDLDFERPFNFLKPVIVLDCLITNLHIEGWYDKEGHHLISGEPTEKDCERVDKLEHIRNTLRTTRETPKQEQKEILLQAIEDFFVIRRGKPQVRTSSYLRHKKSNDEQKQ